MRDKYLYHSGHCCWRIVNRWQIVVLSTLQLLMWGIVGCEGRTRNTGKGHQAIATPCGAKEHGPIDTIVENIALGVYSNGTIERKEIILPDGSRVAMHPGTTLRIGAKFKKGYQELWLNGDALFEEVGTGSGRGKPMIIHTGLLNIEVWEQRSRFRIDAKAKEPGQEVDLLAGKLSVSKSYHSDSDNEPDTIIAGEMVMINRDIDLMEKEKMDGSEMKDWR